MNSPSPVQRIFSDAQQCSTPAAREALLEQACGTDAALRREVNSLLRAADEAGGFLEQPPTGLGTTNVMAPGQNELVEQPGDRIGRYKLLQQIGEGGCGVVYMAEQEEPVRRRVALKVIKLGMDTRQVIARFEAERQALAMMDHPNIARVLDAGATMTGRPYFVMELVRGVRITDFCDQRTLSTRERLGLLTQVCQAIQHAHQKGIIHRDIKPSNILVADHDGVAVPKVIDFGIAKATTSQPLTDKTLFTAFEQFVGTPAYMSPEQANLSGLDVDTRSDIYSLGVLLYELLTGLTPFDATSLLQAGIDAMRRTIREVEPSLPSSRLSTLLAPELTAAARHRQTESLKLIHLIKGDLDWIVMKCLEKDRTRRYDTANDLLSDIQRHLKNEPVLARPPSFRDRGGKWIRRHKGPAVAAGAVAAALCTGLATSTTMYLRERRAWVSESSQRTKAELEAAKSAQTAEFMMEMLAGINPEQSLGRDVSVLTGMLKTAAGRVEQELSGQPEVAAALQATIGHIYGKLGLYAEAQPHLERAHAIRERLLGPEHRQTLDAANRLTTLLRAQGRLPEAEQRSRQLVAISTRVLGPEDRLTLDIQHGLADTRMRQAHFAEAMAQYRRILDVCVRALGPEDRMTLMIRHGVAVALTSQGLAGEAEAIHRATLAIKRRLLGPEHPETMEELNGLASALYHQKKHAEAEALYLQALEVQQRIHGPEHPDTLIPSNNLAIIYLDQEKYAEAAAVFRRDWKICERALGGEHDRTLTAMQNLALAYERQGKLAEAEVLNRETLEISRRVRGPEHPETLDLMHNLAVIVSQHRVSTAEAESLYRETLALKNRTLGPEHRDSLLTATTLLGTLRKDKKTNEAEALCRQTLDHTRRALGPEHAATLKWMNNLAIALIDQGDAGEAESILRQRIALARTDPARDPGETALSLWHLANLTEAAGRWDETLELWSERWTLLPDDTLVPLALAATQAWFRKSDAHAATCRRFFEQAETIREPFAADRAAKAFCLLPSTESKGLATALRLARRAIETGQGQRSMPYYHLTLGMAEYRNGRFAAADQALDSAAQLAGDIPNLQATVLAFQAMSHFRQAQKERARQLLLQAEAAMPPEPADARQPYRDHADHDDLVFWTACREARALLADAPAPVVPALPSQ